jgi:hypothetical protein
MSKDNKSQSGKQSEVSSRAISIMASGDSAQAESEREANTDSGDDQRVSEVLSVDC